MEECSIRRPSTAVSVGNTEPRSGLISETFEVGKPRNPQCLFSPPNDMQPVPVLLCLGPLPSGLALGWGRCSALGFM